MPETRASGRRTRRRGAGRHGAIVAAACVLIAGAGGTRGADSDRAAIRAADAGRHVGALADDALEGREGGSRGGRAAGAYIADVLRAAGLAPAGDQGTYFQRFGTMRNVLALLPGSDPAVADELVVLGAHYDHVGYGNPAQSNGPIGFIHNGADDNASGVAGALEIAESLAARATPPRRPVLVAFWDGEEQGLLGSWHFVRQRPAALAALAPRFSLNLDMIGRLRDRRVEVYGARSAVGLRRALVEANRSEGLELAFDWDIVDDSDHFPFLESRVPSLMLHTGLHPEYHRPEDDAHLVNGAGIESVARLGLATLLALADAPGPLPTFRAACREEGNGLRDAFERPLPVDPSAPRGRWGMSTRSDAGDPAAPVVARVVPGSPLARAGLAPADRILAIDGVALESHDDLLGRLAAAGEVVTLRVERQGRSFDLEARRAIEAPAGK
jgi:hypothetical protein